MRALRFPSLSLGAFVWALALAFYIGVPHLKAQQAGSSFVSPDRVDINAYRTLFRRAVLYKKLADEADTSPNPKPHLRHILADRFGLSDFDGASLERLSLAYQREIDPIHQQILGVISKFHARFPGGVVGKGMDTSPPPELATLQQQDDAVTLLYRDLLRNSMREDDFQKMHAKVREDFGKPLQSQ